MSESNESNEPGKWTVRVLGPADDVPSRSESFTFPTLDEAMEAAVRRWHMHRACGQALSWLPDAESAAAPARPTLHEIMNTPMGPADGSGDWNRYHREAAALNAAPVGWICPACKRVNGPTVRECACKGNLTMRERIHTP